MSPRLVRALEGLGANLGRLAAALDGVVFRDTWRAVAVAATRAIFNDVATEARFSEQARPLRLFRTSRVCVSGVGLCLVDGVVFRDTSRAVAIAATRDMFNDVASEARISEQARPLQSGHLGYAYQE